MLNIKNSFRKLSPLGGWFKHHFHKRSPIIFAAGFAFIAVIALFSTRAYTSTTTVNFSGKLTTSSPTQTFTINPGSGPLTAKLTFATGKGKNQPRMTQVLKNAAGAEVATQTGVNPVILNATVQAGTYQITVSTPDTLDRKGRDFTLSVTYTVPDTISPSVSVALPPNGSTVSGITNITGTATDNVGVAQVTLQVDNGTTSAANGTNSWSYSLDTNKLTNGSHTITVKATDAANNTGTATVTINVSNAAPPPSTCSHTGTATGNDVIIQNCEPKAVSGDVESLGLQHTLGERGSVSAVTYSVRVLVNGTPQIQNWAYFRDSTTGQYSHVKFPDGIISSYNSIIWDHSNKLWVFGRKSNGAGMILRGYQLDNYPLPTSMNLIEQRDMGDSNSRGGDLILLESGAVVGVWSQHGGSQTSVLYRSSAGLWQIMPFTYMTTNSHKDRLAQHPADNSIWGFGISDGWGNLGAFHLTEVDTGLRLDWVNSRYVAGETQYGDFRVDPENPYLNARPDPANNSVAVSYQSYKRQYFTNPNGGLCIGSYPAIARIKADSTKSFFHLPVFIERVSTFGMVVSNQNTWLTYSPLNTTTCAQMQYNISKYSAGQWQTPQQVENSGPDLASGISRAEFTLYLNDNKLHLITTQ